MKKYYYFGIGILFILLISFGLMSEASNVKKTELKENHYIDLRNKVFALNVQSLGREIKDPKKSLCTVMEWKVSNATVATATLVSVIDGSTSLYMSTGEGMIGGKAYKNVVDVSSVFLKESEKHLDLMKKDTDHTLPLKEHVCFYVITNDGIYKYDGLEADMLNGKNQFSGLFIFGQKTIIELQKITQ